MRKILAFVSSRADASPLTPVIERLNYCCVVWPEGESPGDRFKSAFEVVYKNKFDILLVLGDRYETLAAASAATILGIPIAHIHGGEETKGSFDDSIRNSITQLSQIHFTATELAFMRVRTAVTSKNVYLTGAPGLDQITDLPPRNPQKTFVLTYHPETRGTDQSLTELVYVLNKYPDYEVVWTGTNFDPGASRVREALSGFEEYRLTTREYILSCRQAALVIGNSSSGIIEAPTIGVPSVNIGTRQKGREHGPSVFQGGETEIEQAIELALAHKGPFDNPYYRPGASDKIAGVLTTVDMEGVFT